MRILVLFAAVALLVPIATAAEGDGIGVVSPGAGSGRFVHSIPIVGSGNCGQYVATNDWASGTFFIEDWAGSIYELDATTGAVLNSYPNAGGNIHGLAWDGRYLIQNGYNQYVAYFTDKDTGATIYSQPSTGGYGIAWGKYDSPYDDQWLWTADHTTNLISQDDYYTGASVFTFPTVNTGLVGVAFDGINLWTMQWSSDIIECHNPAGGLVTTIGAPSSNPRDGCWDGHYLWSVHWQTATAYQMDLYQEAGFYPVTGCLLPRYNQTTTGGSFTLEVTLLNHTSMTVQTQAWIQAEQVGGGISKTVVGPVNLSMAAGQFLEVDKRFSVPNKPQFKGLWDIYVRVGTFPNADHQGGVVLEVL